MLCSRGFRFAPPTYLPFLPPLTRFGLWGNAETRYYVDCIRKNKEPLARPEEAVVIMKIITSLYKSAEKHKEVTIK